MRLKFLNLGGLLIYFSIMGEGLLLSALQVKERVNKNFIVFRVFEILSAPIPCPCLLSSGPACPSALIVPALLPSCPLALFSHARPHPGPRLGPGASGPKAEGRIEDRGEREHPLLQVKSPGILLWL